MGLLQRIVKARATIAIIISFFTAVVLPLYRFITRKVRKSGVKIVDADGVEVK